jgi:iron-sulfur cluster repair protein YtfE (RIC family)
MNDENEKLEKDLAVIDSLEAENRSLARDIEELDERLEALSEFKLEDKLNELAAIKAEMDEIVSRENYTTEFYAKFDEFKKLKSEIEKIEGETPETLVGDLITLKQEKKQQIKLNEEEISRINDEVNSNGN